MLYMKVGPCPSEVDAVQIGEGAAAMRAECERFREQIRKKFPEPEGARLVVRGNNHEFGTYYEVEVRYDPENDEAVEYAFMCESGDDDCFRAWL